MLQSFWTGSAGGRNIRSGKSLFWKTKFFSGSALMDSGNSLKDPYTGRPVCFGRRDGEKAWNFDGKGGSADSLSQHRQGPRTPSGGDGFRTVSEKRRTGEKDCRCDGCGRTRAFEPVGRVQMILHPALLEEKKGADHDIKSSDAGEKCSLN